jgi:hypothetical protein
MQENCSDLPPMPALPRPSEDLGAWLGLVASGAHVGEPAMLTGRLAHAIDAYWERHREDQPIAALDAIELAAGRLGEIGGLAGTPEAAAFTAAVHHSVVVLRLLHERYLAHLRLRFAGIFIVGSMSYGRFSNVRGNSDARPSDLDLLLVAPDTMFELADILLPRWIEGADEPKRFAQYLRILQTSPADVFNYKLRGVAEGVGVSLTLCTLTGFANLTTLEGGEERRIRLHWKASFDGRANPLPDMAGAVYDARYWETRSGAGNVLILPVVDYAERIGHRLGRPNGLASMLAPRFDHLAMTADVESLLLGLVRGIRKIADAYEHAGLEPHICDLHPRRQRMSHYFRAQMQQRFKRLMQQASRSQNKS